MGRGISGQTTPQMLVRFHSDVVAPEPSVLIKAACVGATSVDYHTAMADERQVLRANLGDDRVHPNEAGYRIMSALVEPAIATALRAR